MPKYVLQYRGYRDTTNSPDKWYDVNLCGTVMEESTISKLIQRVVNAELNPDEFKYVRIIEVDYVRKETVL